MIKVREDLTGQIFGKLTVIQQAEDRIWPGGQRVAQWLCECSCPKHNQIIVTTSSLRSGNTKSCGCIERGRPKGTNQYELRSDDGEEYYVGFASNTGNEFYFDLEDYDVVAKYHWYEAESYDNYHYLSAWDNVNKKQVKLHWLIAGKYCDHIDRNPLNNRRSNLRKATHKENSRNQSKSIRNMSGVVGVGWYKRYNKWVAYIKTDKRKTLGYFDNKDDAIRARLNAEVKYFGEFAPQKHLYEQYGIEELNE
jgi:hypothetical protein